MKGEADSFFQRGTERTDGRGAFETEIFDVHVPPIQYVGDEKGGQDPRAFQIVQLIDAQKLRVYHHGTGGGISAGKLRPNEFFRRHIAVAVHEKL